MNQMPYKKIAMVTLRVLWVLFLAAGSFFFFAVSLLFRFIGSDASQGKGKVREDDEWMRRVLLRRAQDEQRRSSMFRD